MTDCTVCTRALTDPFIGEINQHCRGCRVRYASTLPRIARDRLRAFVNADEGQEAADQWARDVANEYARRKTLAT